ncbi:hypothetical protein AB0436_06160 [Streptomyces sp. NPDC051322]|uniref:hypothetical protein n=1 Tax=Streptomyces sp. NPDC051322 TaxID=3154645 RepID=UPI00344D6748
MYLGIVRGLAAGAAGTTALHAMTYADMAVRARPASSTPDEVVDRLAENLGHPVPGSGSGRESRLSGLGALSGIAVGCGVGSAVALTRRAGVRLPLWLGGLVTGALAMAATDLPMARLGVSDPRSWSAVDWTSDVLPHVVYGLVTYGLITAGDRRT